MQQHPELLLALDIAAYRRQQIQNRLQGDEQPTDRALVQQDSMPHDIAEEPSAREEDPSDTDERRENIYNELRDLNNRSNANSNVAALSLSPNLGDYEYLLGRSTLLS